MKCENVKHGKIIGYHEEKAMYSQYVYVSILIGTGECTQLAMENI